MITIVLKAHLVNKHDTALLDLLECFVQLRHSSRRQIASYNLRELVSRNQLQLVEELGIETRYRRLPCPWVPVEQC
jgi:hypothetical protein